jgi:hypothetical protein
MGDAADWVRDHGERAPSNEARADFGRAWEVFLSKRIEADFQE